MDAIVVRIEKGKGKYKDMMGAIFCKDKEGIEFKIGTGFNDKDRENPPAVGSIVTLKYQEKTAKTYENVFSCFFFTIIF